MPSPSTLKQLQRIIHFDVGAKTVFVSALRGQRQVLHQPGIMGGFAFEHYPYGKGDVLFGRTCQERQIHSITSAAKQHGLKHPRMTILAVGLGLGSKDRHERIEFSAKKYDPILNEFARCLRPKSAAAELGIRVEALQRLAKAGTLKPRFDMPSMVPVYYPSDLEMFRSLF